MPPGITIIGLGVDGAWMPAARTVLQSAPELYLRTRQQPNLENFAGVIHSFDHLFDDPATLRHAPQQLAAALLPLGQRPGGVLYAVPGHPGLAEATTPAIQAAAQANLPVTLLPAPSGLETALQVVPQGNHANLQMVDALLAAGQYHPPLEPDRPALLTNLHGQAMLAGLQASLQNCYPPDLAVTLILPGPSPHTIATPLHQLKEQTLTGVAMLYLPADERHNFSAFQETVAHLRAPDGCPWDQVQTHQSLRPHLLEETYEVLEALDNNDPAALAEELGDLLLQVVLHTQVAIDGDEFQMGDVIDTINRKLLRRHPHVFGDVEVNSIEEVMANWVAIKKEEKAAQGKKPEAASALDGVPPALPALAQALAISNKAVKVGFEWPNIENVVEKVIEEAHEVVEAIDPVHLESEIGDLLFSVVNLARWRGIDPESALRSTNARFTRRFKGIEALAAAQGKRLPEMTLEEMDVLWDQVKANGRA